MSTSTRSATTRGTIGVLLTGLLLTACGAGETAATDSADTGPTGPSVRQVEVHGTEYEFGDVPPEAFPATYEITFVNEGEEDHELSFVELREGTTASSVLEAQEAGEDPATLVEAFLGSTGAVAAGSSAAIEVTLEDGKTYGYACLVEAPDGTPHAVNGMLGEVAATTAAR
jgi:plastocyanin